MQSGVIITIVGLVFSNAVSIIALLIAHKNNKILSKPTIFDDANNRYLREMNKITQAISGLSFQVRDLNIGLNEVTHCLGEQLSKNKD